MEAISITNIVSTGTIIGIAILVLRNNHMESSKRKDIYTKIEETKKESVNKDVCTVVHKSVDDKLNDVQEKVACIPEIKAGVDLLLKR